MTRQLNFAELTALSGKALEGFETLAKETGLPRAQVLNMVMIACYRMALNEFGTDAPQRLRDMINEISERVALKIIERRKRQ